jgi:hypothetical protein
MLSEYQNNLNMGFQTVQISTDIPDSHKEDFVHFEFENTVKKFVKSRYRNMFRMV